MRERFGHVTIRRTQGEAKEGDRAILGTGSAQRAVPVPASPASRPPAPPAPSAPAPRVSPTVDAPGAPGTGTSLRSEPVPRSSSRPRLVVFPLEIADTEEAHAFARNVISEWDDTFVLYSVTGPYRPDGLRGILREYDAQGALLSRVEREKAVIERIDERGRVVASWVRWLAPHPHPRFVRRDGRWGPLRFLGEIAGLSRGTEAALPFGDGTWWLRDEQAVYVFGEEPMDLRRILHPPKGTEGLHRFGDRVAVRRDAIWWFLDPREPDRWRVENPPWTPGEIEPLPATSERAPVGPAPVIEETAWSDLDRDGAIERIRRVGETLEIWIPDPDHGYRLRFRTPAISGLVSFEIRPDLEWGDELWLLVRGPESARVLRYGEADFPVSSILEE